MNQKLAKTISFILHPLLMPTLVFFIVFYFAEIAVPFSEEGRIRLLGLIFISTFLFPFGSIILLHSTTLIGNLQIDSQTQKPLPFVTVTVFYTMITYFFVDKVGLDILPSSMIIAIALTTALVTIISTTFNISIHSTAIGGVLGILFCIKGVYYELHLLIYPIAACIFLAGLLMTARLYLQTHTPFQVFSGAILGFAVCFSVLWWLV
ncbi:hypothetical protein [Chondrinema litorale]|uniref:hypothetical protein n=1 Tax=Chondrinema litorale TaxID=2994555 RepID=UPI00254344D2|nr:hypothetical protein [Chondrinema litorale]UZR93037.1 hypothetical protein OQ292_14340 [Chondrinema litorale]